MYRYHDSFINVYLCIYFLVLLSSALTVLNIWLNLFISINESMLLLIVTVHPMLVKLIAF
jgi:hypothetical protein